MSATIVAMTLAPRIEGVVPVESSGALFAAALGQRVAAGLLLRQPHPRANQQVLEESGGVLRVRAADYWTAINVGLNDLELGLPLGGPLRFKVQYWRWASYVLGLGGIIG